MNNFIKEVESWLAEEPSDTPASVARAESYKAVLQLAKQQTDALQALFYLLLRDKLPAGDVEKLVCEATTNLGRPTRYSNEHLASYAAELRNRVLGDEA